MPGGGIAGCTTNEGAGGTIAAEATTAGAEGADSGFAPASLIFSKPPSMENQKFAPMAAASAESSQPHTAPIGLSLLHCDDVHRMADAACFAQYGTVKGKLVDVAVSLDVSFKPRQIVAGFEIDDP